MEVETERTGDQSICPERLLTLAELDEALGEPRIGRRRAAAGADGGEAFSSCAEEASGVGWATRPTCDVTEQQVQVRASERCLTAKALERSGGKPFGQRRISTPQCRASALEVALCPVEHAPDALERTGRLGEDPGRLGEARRLLAEQQAADDLSQLGEMALAETLSE